MATMPATITLATIDCAGDYGDYAWAAGGGIARPATPLPVAGPWSGPGLIPGGGGVLAACAGPYGRKNTRGTRPRAFIIVLFRKCYRLSL